VYLVRFEIEDGEVFPPHGAEFGKVLLPHDLSFLESGSLVARFGNDLGQVMGKRHTETVLNGKNANLHG
jgi:hypothetical protein